jgi:hypothetical protein
MTTIKVNEILYDDEASYYYKEIIKTEKFSMKWNDFDEDKADLSLLTKDALYEVNFQIHDEIPYYIKRIL